MATQSASETSTTDNVHLIASLEETVENSKAAVSKSLSKLTKPYQFIWHAALGTASLTEKNVSEFTQAMADKGTEVEAKAKEDIDKKIMGVKLAVLTKRKKILDFSKRKINKVEGLIGKGFSRTLHAAGVPTKGDMEQIALLMSEMSGAIEELTALSEKKVKRTPSKTTDS
ncbi:hypothetical protein NBRC116493_21740 [Aurantivibrio infirmus]